MPMSMDAFRKEMDKVNSKVIKHVLKAPSDPQVIAHTLAEIAHLGWLVALIGKIPEGGEGVSKADREFSDEFLKYYTQQVNKWIPGKTKRPDAKDEQKLANYKAYLKLRGVQI